LRGLERLIIIARLDGYDEIWSLEKNTNGILIGMFVVLFDH